MNTRSFIRIFLSLLLLVMGFQCAYAGDGAFFTVTVKSPSLINIQTTAPNHAYPNAAIKINTSSYSLGGVGAECTSVNAGYCLFSVSDTTPKNISLTGSGDTLSLVLCLDGTHKPSSCQNYNLSMAITTPRFAYFTNSGSTAVYVCALSSSTGLITTCQDAGYSSLLGGGTLGITVNNSSTIAYITSEITTTAATFECAINAIDGTFSTCSEVNILVNGSASPYYPYYGMPGLSLDNSILYLNDGYNTTNGRVLACSLKNNVISSECTDTGATDILYEITGISLVKPNATTYAYIGDGYDGNFITVCTANGASFSNCIQKTGGGSVNFHGPIMAAFNPAGTIAYIPDYVDSVVYGCSTNPNNTARFDSCFVASPIGAFFGDAYGIAISRNGSMAYITNSYANEQYQCTILNNGFFGTCTTSTQVPSGVAVALGY